MVKVICYKIFWRLAQRSKWLVFQGLSHLMHLRLSMRHVNCDVLQTNVHDCNPYKCKHEKQLPRFLPMTDKCCNQHSLVIKQEAATILQDEEELCKSACYSQAMNRWLAVRGARR
jgi:hypothetical protein